MRSAVLSAATPLLGAARRTLAAGASNSATAVRAFGRRVGSVQAASRLPISPVWVSPVGAHARAQGHLGGGRGGAATVLLRQMSSEASDGATADEDLDPYLPHRINFERAKDYIKANVTKGMSRDEVAEIVRKAMELHIPPVPTLEELQEQESRIVKEEKEQRLKKDLEASKDEAMRRIPSVDALGRAYATGRRKTAVARVWLTAGTGNVTVNRKMMVDYFKRITLRDEIYLPMQVVGGALKFDVWATVIGGGMSSQAGAIRLGVARALQAFDLEHRTVLKEHRLLTQDDRKVERKKPGQPKARKQFAWVKR